MSLRFLISAVALISPTLARPSQLSSRDVCSGNTASTRSKWCSYSIETDYMTGKSFQILAKGFRDANIAMQRSLIQELPESTG